VELQGGWVYDIKADSNSYRRAWGRYAAAPPALCADRGAGSGWRRSRAHSAMDGDRPRDQVKFLLTV